MIRRLILAVCSPVLIGIALIGFFGATIIAVIGGALEYAGHMMGRLFDWYHLFFLRFCSRLLKGITNA